jgi:hypothetical protein
VDDHLCDQIRIHNGIGDLTEDFVEQSHQTGIRHNQRSRSMKDNSTSAKWHVRREEKETNPVIVEKIKGDQLERSAPSALVVKYQKLISVEKTRRRLGLTTRREMYG